MVVTAERPVTRAERDAITTGFNAPGYDPHIARLEFFQALGAARCAVNRRLVSPALLRGVIDGDFNSSRHDRQVSWVVRQTLPCGAGGGKFDANTIATASEAMPGTLYRGAFMVQVMKRYAPGLTLTRAELRRPEVRERFTARERPRNRLRLPRDLLYLQVASCFVENQPEQALRAVYSDDVGVTLDAMARMAHRAPPCVGGSKQLGFDPYEMRGYLADAAYRWTLAVRGVDSLLPTPD